MWSGILLFEDSLPWLQYAYCKPYNKKKPTKISKMKYRKQVNREDKMRTQKYSNNLKENKTKNSSDRK